MKRRHKGRAAASESIASLYCFHSIIRLFRLSLLASLSVIILCSGCVSSWKWPNLLNTGSTAKKGYEYRVARGDSLWAISRKTGVSVNTLTRTNRLRNPDHLEVGQRLWIPGEKSSRLTATNKKVSSRKTVTRKTSTNTRTSTVKKKATSSNTKMIWPIQGSFTVVSRFGPGNGGLNRGIDLTAAEGTPVVAVMDGVVTYAGTQTSRVGKILGFGNHIYLSHSNGLITIYAHNRINLVRAGEKVKKGQKIAEVGNTGNTRGPTGYHLHFEVRDQKTTEAVNPEKYLPAR